MMSFWKPDIFGSKKAYSIVRSLAGSATFRPSGVSGGILIVITLAYLARASASLRPIQLTS